MSTSFIQFKYCNLCRTNHRQKRKKHIYSSRHQTVLKNALTKFSKKIADAKALTASPLVQSHGWEAGAAVWCYFCQMEVKKHREHEDSTLVCGGLIEHASSVEHSQKMAEFFWDNIIPVSRKPEFVIDSKDYNRYLVKSAQAVAYYQAKMRERIAQEAARISQASRRSQVVKWMGMTEQHVKQTYGTVMNSGKRSAKASEAQHTVDPTEATERKKTVAAYGEGLTCIIRPEAEEEDESVGNIFTGATPPWLWEEAENTRSEIGPTMEDFSKHLEQEKKRKLPACRVGAKFNHKEKTSADWLPSFGRVWNYGRRLNSHRQFQKEKRSASSTITSSDFQTAIASDSSQPFPSEGCVPYKRKKTLDVKPDDRWSMEASSTDTAQLNDVSAVCGSNGVRASIYAERPLSVDNLEHSRWTHQKHSWQLPTASPEFYAESSYSAQTGSQSQIWTGDIHSAPPGSGLASDSSVLSIQYSHQSFNFSSDKGIEANDHASLSEKLTGVNPTYIMPYQRQRQPKSKMLSSSQSILIPTPILSKAKNSK